MSMSNKKKWKNLILAYSNTRKLYYIMQGLILFLIISTGIFVIINLWIESNIDQQKEQLFGSWDDVFVGLNKEDVSYFKNHAYIEDYAIQTIQDRIIINDKRIVVGSASNDFFQLGNIEIISGRLPEREKEIAVEEEYLSVLGIKAVGDRIPESVDIPWLKDYRVCGIIENYSEVWNYVNQDVKYVNCFIKNSCGLEIQAFVKFDNYIKTDVENNFLNYYNNFSFKNEFLFSNIAKIWGSIIVLLFVIGGTILNKCKKNIAIIFYERKKSMFNNRLFKITGIFLYCVGSFVILSLLLNLFFKEGMFFYDLSKIIHGNSKALFIDLSNFDNKLLFDNEVTSTVFKTLFYPSFEINLLLKDFITFLWLILIEIGTILYLLKILKEKLNNNVYKIYTYFYGDNNKYEKKIRESLFRYFLLEYLMGLIVLITREFEHLGNHEIAILFLKILVFLSITSLIKILILNFKIEQIENDKDWLLLYD